MSAAACLEFGRTAHGYVARVNGRGTMNVSPAFLQFASRILADNPNAVLVLNLATCEYLDSTFLGCLLTLHKRFSVRAEPRFLICAAGESQTQLLHRAHLDQVLMLTECEPESPVEWQSIPVDAPDQSDFSRHLLETHRELSQLGSGQAAEFGPVVEQLERALKQNRRT